MNDNLLRLMGKLALCKALIQSTNISVNEALETYEKKGASFDKKQLTTIIRISADMDYSEHQIDDVIFDLATEIFNSVLNEGGNNDAQKHQN